LIPENDPQRLARAVMGRTTACSQWFRPGGTPARHGAVYVGRDLAILGADLALADDASGSLLGH
jgi:hypothetical protein